MFNEYNKLNKLKTCWTSFASCSHEGRSLLSTHMKHTIKNDCIILNETNQIQNVNIF